MAIFVEVVRPLRRTEYDALVGLGAFREERIELLDGTLVPMSPIGPGHSSAVQRLLDRLHPALLGRATVRIQSLFAAHELSEPEPDIAVVPRGDYADAHPSQAYLIIEVADSSLTSNRNAKLPIYAVSGAPEYWIVNLPERCIEVHTCPSARAYSSVSRIEHGQSLHPQRFPDVVLSVAGLIR